MKDSLYSGQKINTLIASLIESDSFHLFFTAIMVSIADKKSEPAIKI